MQTCTWPVQVSTSHVRACSLACMPAQGLCTHVLRRAGQHKADARMQSRVLACTPEVPARREFERYADQRFWQGDSVTHCETRADGRHHQFHKPNRVPGSSEKLHLVKRFTPASDETIIYQFTKTVPRSYGAIRRCYLSHHLSGSGRRQTTFYRYCE